MKKELVISTMIHLVIVATMAIWSTAFRHWQRKIDVYQVELVSMPPLPPKVTMEETPPKPAPVEKKPPEPDVKKPEQTPVVKPKTKPEKPVEKPREKKESSPIGGDKQVKVDIQDFPFAYYLNLLRYRISQNWNPPYQQTWEEGKISVVVGFTVERSGRLTEIKVEDSSGKFMFDQAALRAVATAGPLPPLPDEYSKERLTVHIEFEALW